MAEFKPPTEKAKLPGSPGTARFQPNQKAGFPGAPAFQFNASNNAAWSASGSKRPKGAFFGKNDFNASRFEFELGQSDGTKTTLVGKEEQECLEKALPYAMSLNRRVLAPLKAKTLQPLVSELEIFIGNKEAQAKLPGWQSLLEKINCAITGYTDALDEESGRNGTSEARPIESAVASAYHHQIRTPLAGMRASAQLVCMYFEKWKEDGHLEDKLRNRVQKLDGAKESLSQFLEISDSLKPGDLHTMQSIMKQTKG